MYVGISPSTLAKAERRRSRRLGNDDTGGFRGLPLKFEGPYCVHATTDTVVHTVWDSDTTSVDTECFTKLLTAPRAMQFSVASGSETSSRAATTKSAINARATV